MRGASFCQGPFLAETPTVEVFSSLPRPKPQRVLQGFDLT